VTSILFQLLLFKNHIVPEWRYSEIAASHNIYLRKPSLFKSYTNFVNILEGSKIDELVKSRHSREACPRSFQSGSGYPETLQLPKKTGFPIKDFGNDNLKRTSYETVKIKVCIEDKGIHWETLPLDEEFMNNPF
jgi:hypothetical protein